MFSFHSFFVGFFVSRFRMFFQFAFAFQFSIFFVAFPLDFVPFFPLSFPRFRRLVCPGTDTPNSLRTARSTGPLVRASQPLPRHCGRPPSRTQQSGSLV